MRRYSNAPVLSFGKKYGTSDTISKIRAAIESGDLSYEEILLKGSERLDVISWRYYGDSKLWWAIAAASSIGWGLQAPPGTIIRIPLEEEIAKYLD